MPIRGWFGYNAREQWQCVPEQKTQASGSSMVEGSFGSYLCMSASWPVCCAWNVSESDSEREAKGGEDTTEWGNELL